MWNKAKTLYTNDIQLIFKVVSDIVHLQQNQQDIATFLGLVGSLKDEFDSLMPLSLLECESCQLGKHTRASFPKSRNNRATSMFNIVHSDIRGPSRVNSSLGFH